MTGDLAGATAALRAHAAEARADGVTYAETHMMIIDAMSLGYSGRDEEADAAIDAADQLAARLGSRLLHTIAAFARTIVVLDRRPEEAVGHAQRTLQLAATIRATWFLGAGANYLVAALARTDDPARALDPLRHSLDRQLAGGAVQSVANAIRNTVVVLDRLGPNDEALALLGWLDVNRPSIPGTPGMREHPQTFGRRIRTSVGETVFRSAAAAGAILTAAEVIRVALDALPS